MHDLFLFGTEGTVGSGGVDGIADAVLIRRNEAGGKVESVALFGADATITLDGRPLHATGGAEFFY
jgi:hypothetical protein